MKQDTYDFEEKFLSPYAFKSANAGARAFPVTECVLRTDFQRDRDRIIHSKSFRRLKHKTQVFLSPEGDHYRTRLTHTLEVAQIARTIARALKLNEDLVEAIALGHDLGHTPFGHEGERVLNRLTDNEFMHNKQSVRVVTLLEDSGKGLNLTPQVIDGILQHRTDGNPATLEGKTVFFADQIAYINHDIDDGIRAGLMSESNLPEECTRILGNSKGRRIQNLVYNLVENSAGKPVISYTPDFEKALNLLREYMFKNLYTLPAAKSEEVKAARMIEMLFHYYIAHTDALPEFYRSLLADWPARTVVADYIASMSDRYAVMIFEKLFVPEAWTLR